MNTLFKVFASYNILQYLCDFIHVLYICNCLKMPKKSQINEYSNESCDTDDAFPSIMG